MFPQESLSITDGRQCDHHTEVHLISHPGIDDRKGDMDRNKVSDRDDISAIVFVLHWFIDQVLHHQLEYDEFDRGYQ